MVRFRNGDKKSLKSQNVKWIRRAETLKTFFESEYELGLNFGQSMSVAEYTWSAVAGTPLYLHTKTGIQIWQHAIICKRKDDEVDDGSCRAAARTPHRPMRRWLPHGRWRRARDDRGPRAAARSWRKS